MHSVPSTKYAHLVSSEYRSYVFNGLQTKQVVKRLRFFYCTLLYITLRRRRSVWVCPIFVRRRQRGEYHQLLQEMHLADPESHFHYLRKSKERFEHLLAMTSHRVLLIHIRVAGDHEHHWSVLLLNSHFVRLATGSFLIWNTPCSKLSGPHCKEFHNFHTWKFH